METKPTAPSHEARPLSTMHADALAIFDCAVKAADPAHLVSQCLSLTPHPTLPSSHTLTLHTPSHTSTYTLTPSTIPPSPHSNPTPSSSSSPPTPTYSTILLISIGKASIPMATFAYALLSPTPYLTGGLVITNHLPPTPSPTPSPTPTPTPPLPFPIIQAGHPLPTQSSLDSATALLTLLRAHSAPSLLTLLLLGRRPHRCGCVADPL